MTSPVTLNMTASPASFASLTSKKSRKNSAFSGGSEAERVRQCYDAETERLRRQTQVTEASGWLGALANVGKAALENAKGKIGVLGAPVVDLIVEGGKASLEAAHAIENLDADNCEQMAATATLHALASLQSGTEGLESGVQEIQSSLSDSQAMVRDLREEVQLGRAKSDAMMTTLLSHAEQSQQQVHELETSMSLAFTRASRQASRLNAKLDMILMRLDEATEKLQLDNYNSLAAQFSSAISASSAAFDDMQAAVQELQLHRRRLDISVSDVAAVKAWQDVDRLLRLQVRSRMQDSWVRSRDNFAKSIAIITEGDFLTSHYTMLLRDTGSEWLANSNHKTAQEVFQDGGLQEAFASALEKDDLLQTLELLIIRVASMAATMAEFGGTGPSNRLVFQALLKPIEELKQYLVPVLEGFNTWSYLHQIAHEPLLEQYGMEANCAQKAVEQGFTMAPQDWVKWTSKEENDDKSPDWGTHGPYGTNQDKNRYKMDVYVQKPALAMESTTDSGFFYCVFTGQSDSERSIFHVPPTDVRERDEEYNGCLYKPGGCVKSRKVGFKKSVSFHNLVAAGGAVQGAVRFLEEATPLLAKAGEWITVMKIGKTSRLGFSSALWENEELLNENSNLEVEGDAKYESYLTESFSSIRMCVGSPSTNCVEHKFPKTYSSARELFSSGYIRDESINQDGLLKVFGPEKGSYQECGMQKPGFNIECKDGNRARWGYCNNCADQSCQTSDSQDADGTIGIGLTGQHTSTEMGAGWTSYFASGTCTWSGSHKTFTFKSVWVSVRK